MNIEYYASVEGDTLYASLHYPRSRPVRYVQLSLFDVWASDGFRTHYDFDRDGWVIEQASRWAWEDGDEVCDPDWQEVAFIKSWARDPRKDEGTE
jgi:hypothetical protein